MDNNKLDLLKKVCLATAHAATAFALMTHMDESSAPTGRRWFVRPHNQFRQEYGFFETWFWVDRYHDPERFKFWARMTPTEFDWLETILRPALEKFANREPVSVAEQLAMTLHHLGHGTSYTMIAHLYGRGISTVSTAIPAVCEVIWGKLSEIYLKPVATKDDWLFKASRFWEVWNLPNCVSAIDGKHIRIAAPYESGSLFYNYHHFSSIVLMAAADADCLFTFVDIGGVGSNNDAAIFSNSVFGKAILEERVNLPDPMPLPGEEDDFPFFFAADNAFPLCTNILTPFCHRHGDFTGTHEQLIFNYRFSRGRRIVESTFGIMTQKWGIFKTTIDAKAEVAKKIVQAAVVLHNWLRSKQLQHSPCHQHDAAQWARLPSANQNATPLPTRVGMENRDRLMDYFNNSDVGILEYQDQMLLPPAQRRHLSAVEEVQVAMRNANRIY